MSERKSNTTPVIQVRDLTVRYGRRKALDSVSIQVEQGEVYALLGRNGAGKTSLVSCLLGHRKGQSRGIALFGDEVWRHHRTILRRVGVVPEEPDAPPDWTAGQLSRFYSTLYPRWDERVTTDRMKRFRIAPDQRFGKLSKGQKGQLMLTLALAGQPDLLVLDDPTLGLDAVARSQLFDELIGELADRGTSVLISTHDLAGVEGIADRVGILREGKLVLDEPLESVKDRHRRIRATAAPDQTAVPALLEPLGVISFTAHELGREWVVDRYQDDALTAHQDTGEAMPLSADPMSLEEIFITLTGDAVEERR